MTEKDSEKIFKKLLKIPGNKECADCGRSKPKWASYNIGIFLCSRCANVHRNMGAHISKVKHLNQDQWESSELSRLEEVGNAVAKARYEQRVPPFYRRPLGRDEDPQILVEQWILAKYYREDFCSKERLPYTSGVLSDYLMKRSKNDSRYHSRKFILSASDETLRYFVKESGDPKTILKVSEINVALAPSKMNNANSMQLSFPKEGVTRHIFLFHDNPVVLINWYMAIRSIKFQHLKTKYPDANNDFISDQLTTDFAAEGWLWKTGPRHTDSFKKRWFTLSTRTILYHEDPLDPHPKGEVSLINCSVHIGCENRGNNERGFTFSLSTPQRTYNLLAASEVDRDFWIRALTVVIERTTNSANH